MKENRFENIEQIYELMPQAVLLPICRGDKKPLPPLGSEWPKRTFKATQAPNYLRALKSTPNTAVVLGAQSGGICAIDIDDDKWVEPFLELNPDFRKTLRTRGNRGAAFWVRMNGHCPPHKITYVDDLNDPKAPDKLEIRANGCYSLLRGIHKESTPSHVIAYVIEHRAHLLKIDDHKGIVIPEGLYPRTEKKGGEKGRRGRTEKKGGGERDDPLINVLADHIEALCREFFPNGRKLDGEYRIGNIEGKKGQSVGISLSRKNPGVWYEFNGEKGGGFIELLSRHRKIDHAEALRLIKKRFPQYWEPDGNAVIYHPSRADGLLVFCRELAARINQVDGEIYNSCGKCVLPQLSRQIEIENNQTVETERPCLVPLKSQVLRSEIQRHVRIYREGAKGNVSPTLPNDLALAICSAPEFINSLRSIRGVCNVKLPCGIREGKLIALQEGFNQESGILVKSGGFDFDRTWSIKRAKDFYDRIYGEFCFRIDDQARSMAVVVAMNLTLFGFYLLPPDSVRPAFLANANREGAGKSLLVKAALIPVFGSAVLAAMPPIEEQRQKAIFSAALCRDGVLVWDNITASEIKSPSLEQLVTSVNLSDRILHTQSTEKVRHELVVLLTTNGARPSPSLRRRSLSIELRLKHLRAEDRKIEWWLDDGRLKALRAEFCSANWGILAHWARQGCPPSKKTIPSFERWSEMFGGIVEAAGYASPVLSPHAPRGVTTILSDLALEEIVKKMGEKHPGEMMTTEEIYEFCRKLPCVKKWLGIGRSDFSAAKARQRLGILFQHHEGDIVKGFELVRERLNEDSPALITAKKI